MVYPLIDAIHAATKLGKAGDGISAPAPAFIGSGEMMPPPPASTARGFGDVARMRRSALDFIGGARSMSFAQLSTVLRWQPRRLPRTLQAPPLLNCICTSIELTALIPACTSLGAAVSS